MPDLRDIKRRARHDLHQAMKVMAYYYAPVTELPTVVFVRVHYDFNALGDVRGTSFGYAERRDMDPQLIFMLEPTASQPNPIDPDRHAAVIVSATEGYRIDNLDVVDFITRKAYCVRMTPEEIARKYVAPPEGFIAGGFTAPLAALDGAAFHGYRIVGELEAVPAEAG